MRSCLAPRLVFSRRRRPNQRIERDIAGSSSMETQQVGAMPAMQAVEQADADGICDGRMLRGDKGVVRERRQRAVSLPVAAAGEVTAQCNRQTERANSVFSNGRAVRRVRDAYSQLEDFAYPQLRRFRCDVSCTHTSIHTMSKREARTLKAAYNLFTCNTHARMTSKYAQVEANVSRLKVETIIHHLPTHFSH